MTHQQSYIPALGIARLTPLYDTAMASIFQERRLRMPLVSALHMDPGQRVLDIGCGTATLSLLIAEHTIGGFVAGLDIDPAMLATAQRKVAQSGAMLSLAQASAASLPYADGSFDNVVSSLMLHHLPTEQKRRMLREAWRVLRPDGEILVMDFGPVGSGALAQIVAALFGRFERVDDNLMGRVPDFLQEAGFVAVTVDNVAFAGVVKLYRGAEGASQPRVRLAQPRCNGLQDSQFGA